MWAADAGAPWSEACACAMRCSPPPRSQVELPELVSKSTGQRNTGFESCGTA
jgi:hypothetical protein